ncbi:MAG: histidine triad nucleotide-binding protein [Chloroflexi bacterium]|nr:histidine triad nucleotide-binding protein [Chloroflexota bacterium]
MSDDCIFCKIIAGDIPCSRVYEDDHVLAFNDINPKARVHVLVVPKVHFDRLHESDEVEVGMLGRILVGVGKVASANDITGSGYRVQFNQGRGAGQEVFHLHAHVMSA